MDFLGSIVPGLGVTSLAHELQDGGSRRLLVRDLESSSGAKDGWPGQLDSCPAQPKLEEGHDDQIEPTMADQK